ncbi:MAG: 4-(cytidine 5'-diphospho)-2-C-methyl-D-erythritol kinase [Alphaproteobacteria bacterium]|nr:4-(cytidine 5'-diphospho)-2-C-methyl-D-erythritol kinase [Alphaproteobacteria bacterium]
MQIEQENAERIIFAPAKINLYLNILERYKTGYHSIDSLVVFCDIGDEIKIEPSEDFQLKLTGPFSRYLLDKTDNLNLVTRAATSYADIAQKPLDFKITLTKNLPVAAGLGGGSSDAAATICGLRQIWQLPENEEYLGALLLNLGADVPVCMRCEPSHISNKGQVINLAPPMPEIPVVLVNPLKPCPTQDVFTRFKGPFKESTLETLPDSFDTIYDLVAFIKKQDNDLYEPATQLVPEIKNIVSALSLQNGCLISRMSGSGASVFALFENEESAQNAQKHISEENPDWWVKQGWINRVERY